MMCYCSIRDVQDGRPSIMVLRVSCNDFTQKHSHGLVYQLRLQGGVCCCAKYGSFEYAWVGHSRERAFGILSEHFTVASSTLPSNSITSSTHEYHSLPCAAHYATRPIHGCTLSTADLERLHHIMTALPSVLDNIEGNVHLRYDDHVDRDDIDSWHSRRGSRLSAKTQGGTESSMLHTFVVQYSIVPSFR